MPTSVRDFSNADQRSILPDVAILEAYEKLQPGLLSRILDAWEAEAKHIREMEQRALEAAAARDLRGQRFGLIAVLAALAVSTYALFLGQSTAASIIGGTTVVSVAGVFVVGRRGVRSDKHNDSEE